MGLGILYFSNPLVGASAVLIGKLVNSPTARLRMARFLDKLSDAEKLQISKAIRDNKISPTLERVIE